MSKLFRFIATEASKALPPTLFFMGVFHVAMLIRHLDEESYGITPARSASATIAALVFWKLYLLLGDRRFMNVFAGRPLMYSTIWKTLLYSLLGSFALLCEEMFPLLHHHLDFATAWKQYLSETLWPLFLANHLFIFLSVLAFTSASELIQAVGRERVRTLFFGAAESTRPARR